MSKYSDFKKTKLTTTSLKGMQNVLISLISVGMVDSNTNVAELFSITEELLSADNEEVSRKNINYELE